jgi:hypothetical protein
MNLTAHSFNASGNQVSPYASAEIRAILFWINADAVIFYVSYKTFSCVLVHSVADAVIVKGAGFLFYYGAFAHSNAKEIEKNNRGNGCYENRYDRNLCHADGNRVPFVKPVVCFPGSFGCHDIFCICIYKI